MNPTTLLEHCLGAPRQCGSQAGRISHDSSASHTCSTLCRSVLQNQENTAEVTGWDIRDAVMKISGSGAGESAQRLRALVAAAAEDRGLIPGTNKVLTTVCNARPKGSNTLY